jgi:hypothetical protein
VHMTFRILTLCLALVAPASAVLVEGCTPATTQKLEAVAADLSPPGACAVQALLSGGFTDPALILGMCVNLTLQALANIVRDLLANPPSNATTDAGLVGTGVMIDYQRGNLLLTQTLLQNKYGVTAQPK